MKMQVVNCPNCNGQVQIDESRDFGFCSYCGTKVIFSKEAPANATEAFTNNREAALDEIAKVLNHFKPLAGYSDRLADVDKRLGITKKRLYNEYIIGGAILAFLGFSSAIGGGSIPSIIFGMLLTGGGVSLILYRLKKMEQRKEALDELEDERNVLSSKIQNLYDTYPNCPVGFEYCKPDILNTLYVYIKQGRAETIKEAINLLASEEHNAEMRKIALETQKIAQENLRVSQARAKRR